MTERQATNERGIDNGFEILRAIAHPVRIPILLHVSKSDRCVTELSAALAIPAPRGSHQLRHLRHARLVHRQAAPAHPSGVGRRMG
ncbi:hypothetical protein DLE60_24685 [Micromonospora globispora]|uniref:HTH arsR-type domain-containing protein n=1 Tax=Micromonospora globispora TaxID=1450148 RepID=A0A317KIE7_9ACTN|nr:ArsR family transcriptional regulator [Micromonospora globispora]PWU51478.1 hypothetical protein DLJ46_04990 [Micromonospora globispora]PWU57366.1 hypothetical protein DLE60_24685 [Micromonospora globispora]RQX00652.1 hypothetical protein DKL51_06570 [Micromonospora globispora]